MAREARSLTHEDRLTAFRQATKSLPKRYASQIENGMTDADLTVALEAALGIWGGSCGPGMMDVVHQASELKIWGGWHFVNHVTEPPLFQGTATLAMAREVYGIADPDDQQMNLL